MAAARLRTESLQRWFCKKYNRPSKDPLLAEYTEEELMIEYLMDAIENDPAEEFPRDVQRSGLYGRKTGDAQLDKWQEDAALGNKIDFSEAFRDPEALKQFEAAKASSRARHRGQAVDAEDDDGRAGGR